MKYKKIAFVNTKQTMTLEIPVIVFWLMKKMKFRTRWENNPEGLRGKTMEILYYDELSNIKEGWL